jgi:hypothetical protein
MQYNQPLDQKTNPNAPYVDGDPDAGIQGSIVPAAALEFDQREVIEVISRANSRGYSDFSDTPCAPPANADLMQLRKAIEGFIKSIPVPQFPSDLIDSTVTFHVHGTSPDFPDLFVAMEYLSKYKITQHGFVILQVAGASSGTATVYNYTNQLFFDHPSNHRIGICGAPMLAPVPTTLASYAITGNTAPQRAADAVTNLAMLRTKFATELHFTLGCGLEIDNIGLGFLDAILVSGDHSTGPTSDQQLIAACGTSDTTYWWVQGPTIHPPQGVNGGLAAINGNWGFTCIGGGETAAYWCGGPLVAFGNNLAGLVANSRCEVYVGNAAIMLGNGSDGIITTAQSINYFANCLSACNAGQGVSVAYNSTLMCYGGQIWKNAGAGMYVLDASYAAAVADYGAGANVNGSVNVFAYNSSTINLAGSANVNPASPAINGGPGNNNSYIFLP